MKPGGWEDVCASLAFEEEGEPEGERCAAGWEEGGYWALFLVGIISQLQVNRLIN